MARGSQGKARVVNLELLGKRQKVAMVVMVAIAGTAVVGEGTVEENKNLLLGKIGLAVIDRGTEL